MGYFQGVGATVEIPSDREKLPILRVGTNYFANKSYIPIGRIIDGF